MRFFPIPLLFLTILKPVFSQTKDQRIVSGTVLVNNKTQLDPKTVLNALRLDWRIPTDSVNTADKTIVFNTRGATVMIAQLEYPADPIEIRAAGQLSWMWKTATDEALRHQS